MFKAFHAGEPSSVPDMTVERLPFTVRLIRNKHDLMKAVKIRQSAYARHMPDVAEKLGEPESHDTEDGSAIFLAESKLDGSPLGSARVQTNRHKPLALEEFINLPDWLKGRSLAHVSRLGIEGGPGGRLVKLMLFKGLFKYWEQNGVEWAVVAARAPLDRMYLQLMFQDLFPEKGFVPLPHMNNIPHRLMAFEVGTARQRWTEAKHPLLDFIISTRHPDLHIGARDDGLAIRSRAFNRSTLGRLSH
jgi:hypothetical protein